MPIKKSGHLVDSAEKNKNKTKPHNTLSQRLNPLTEGNVVFDGQDMFLPESSVFDDNISPS